MDNTTGITYINNMGGTRSVQCNYITREIFYGVKIETYEYNMFHYRVE